MHYVLPCLCSNDGLVDPHTSHRFLPPFWSLVLHFAEEYLCFPDSRRLGKQHCACPEIFVE